MIKYRIMIISSYPFDFVSQHFLILPQGILLLLIHHLIHPSLLLQYQFHLNNTVGCMVSNWS